MEIILMSGIPGSGKSTYVDKYYPEAEVCSANRFFEKNGIFRFDPYKLADAHGSCLRDFVDLLTDSEEGDEGDIVVVVDNTNTTILELAPYVALARAYGIRPTLITLHCSAEKAHARNIHDVPLQTITWMEGRLRYRRLPPSWNLETVDIHD